MEGILHPAIEAKITGRSVLPLISGGAREGKRLEMDFR
jgi:hypothetical protein